MVVVYKRTSRPMKGCVQCMCIKCVAYKAVPLFVSSCFLSLANLYEEVLCGLTAEEVWKLVLDYKQTAVHLISV